MAENRKLLTTRSLPKRTAAPAPDPETRPKPILSNKLKLRTPGIPPEKLPNAIDRSGEKKAMLTTHVHLAPKEKPATKTQAVELRIQAAPLTAADSAQIAEAIRMSSTSVGQTAKPATKGKTRK